MYTHHSPTLVSSEKIDTMSNSTSQHHRPGKKSPRSTFGKVTTTEGGNLFKLALELREMIYEYHFSQERQQTSPASLWMGESRSTLLLKLPLLRTSKVVRADALPSFYKCHTFRIQHPANCWALNCAMISHFMTSGIQPMRRVELLTPCDEIEVTIHAPQVGPYLQGFLDLFPQLRLLILHFFDNKAPVQQKFNSSKHGKFDPFTLKLLKQLSKRLDRLEMVLYHPMEDTQKCLNSLKVLAPKSRWIQESSGDAGGLKEGSRRTVWSLSRRKTSKIRKSSKRNSKST